MPEPTAPVLEISAESCTAEIGGTGYSLSVTHLLQGITTVAVTEPEGAKGVVYSFSGNGCEITLGDLSFKTDKSYMSDNALPQMIHEVFTSAQAEDALAYTESETPSASTLTTAVFNGKCDSFSYEIATDYESGEIKEIRIPNKDCILRFSYK